MWADLIEFYLSTFTVLTDVMGRVVGRLHENDLGPDGAAHLAPALLLMTGMTKLSYVHCVVLL